MCVCVSASRPHGVAITLDRSNFVFTRSALIPSVVKTFVTPFDFFLVKAFFLFVKLRERNMKQWTILCKYEKG